MRTLLLVLTTLSLLVVLPAGAQEPDCRLAEGAETATTDDDIEVCRTQAWITEGDTKVGNLDGTNGSFPTWDDTAPEASVTAGAGGGYAGSSLHQLSGSFDPTYTPVFEGTTSGHLDNLLVELYLFPLQNMAEQAADQPDGGVLSVDANLYVDGRLVAVHGGLPLELEDAGDAVKKVRFGWSGLLRSDLGDGEHDVRLEVVGTGIGSELAVWVYDTTEVPSNLIFNATDDEVDATPGA